MLTAVEIADRTDIVYWREDLASSVGMPGGAVNLLNPMFSFTGTGYYTRPEPNIQPKFFQEPLFFQLPSTTTGSELPGLAALLLLLVLAAVWDSAATDYRATFDFKDWMQTKSHTRSVDQASSPDTNSASIQAERLREISGLKVERLAEIFGVSRTTYYKWVSGSPLHDVHREHLLEVLSLMEEAAQRLGSPGATNTWLLTPVSPGGKKPIDYLAAREYSIFRGFLLRVRTGREVFRSLAPSNRVHQERSREEVEDALERLRPRAWRDEDDEDASGIGVKDA